MANIRVLLVDDHAVVREGYRRRGWGAGNAARVCSRAGISWGWHRRG